jgi:hypothetical protein
MNDEPNNSLDTEASKPNGQVAGQAPAVTIESGEELFSVTSDILVQTSHTLDIVSRHLDPIVYDQPEIVDLIKHVALGSRKARIRIVITDLRPVVSRGHRLLELAQRLTSFISIRVPGHSHKNFNEAMLIADNSAYIHRPFADRYEGEAHLANRGKARGITSRFEELWEKADTHPSLRRLHI